MLQHKERSKNNGGGFPIITGRKEDNRHSASIHWVSWEFCSSRRGQGIETTLDEVEDSAGELTFLSVYHVHSMSGHAIN